MRVRFRPPMFVVASALVALIALLATLQYQWLGRISNAERERMTATLNARAAAFAQDVDRELTRAYLLFQLDPLQSGDNLAAPIAARYDRWQASARYPRMIKDYYVVTRGEGDALRLQRFNPATRFVEPAEWPDAMKEIRAQVERAPGLSVPGTTPVVVHNPAGPLWDQVPAIVVPMPLIVVKERRLQTDVSVRLFLSYTVLLLDREYLTRDMLPAIAQQHFRGTGDGFDYQLAVVSTTGAGAVYQSAKEFAPAPEAKADAKVDLFQVRTQEFGALAAEVRRFTTFMTVARRGAPAITGRLPSGNGRLTFREAGPLSIVVAPKASAAANEAALAAGLTLARGSNATAPPTPPRWRLLVKHPSGSLENAVTLARRRNLSVSSSILVVLVVSLGFLVVSTRRAQDLARRQLEFVAAVSHELRTPLAVIRSAADNLADGVVRDETQVRQYGELVRGEGHRLTEMVEQILELAGIHSGQRSFALAPVNVGPLVEEVLQASRALVDNAALGVEVTIAQGLPPVLGDEAAIRRVLQNLIGNAIKYGASGGWIRVDVRSQGRDVQITVADNGIGIDAAEHGRIFEPFYRAPGVVAAQVHGAGLGLSLVKRIVDAHGGRVSVTSAPGRGAAFTIHLPAIYGAVEPRTPNLEPRNVEPDS